jgi:hypothetical protein
MAHDSKMIESTEQFADDARGQAELWSAEMAAADKEVEKWHQAGTKIVDRFLDKRTGNQARGNTSRLNLFTSNITTLLCTGGRHDSRAPAQQRHGARG